MSTGGNGSGGNGFGGNGSGDAIRAEIARRLSVMDGWTAATGRPGTGPRVGDLARELGEVRVLATRAGLAPAVAVVALVDSALAQGERGALVRGWLGVLRDAVACERRDVAAVHAFAAACSVRLAG